MGYVNLLTRYWFKTNNFYKYFEIWWALLGISVHQVRTEQLIRFGQQ